MGRARGWRSRGWRRQLCAAAAAYERRMGWAGGKVKGYRASAALSGGMYRREVVPLTSLTPAICFILAAAG